MTTKKKEKKYPTLYPTLKDMWMKYYKHKTGKEYYFCAKDAGSLTGLIDKIIFQLTEHQTPATDEIVTINMRAFLASITDKWVLENLELPIVNSKFNVLFKNAVNKSPEAATARLNDLVASKFANRNTGPGR